MSDDAPSTSILAGQLGFLFEDDPATRDASDDELAAKMSHDDRWARAREKYPILSDDEVAQHLDEFDDRITPAMVRTARATLS